MKRNVEMNDKKLVEIDFFFVVFINKLFFFFNSVCVIRRLIVFWFDTPTNRQ